MKTVVQKAGYISVATLTSLEQTLAAGGNMFGPANIDDKIKGSGDSLDVAAQKDCGKSSVFPRNRGGIIRALWRIPHPHSLR